MLLNNMLRQATAEGLAAFKVKQNVDGSWPCPFEWRSLNLTPDMELDMLCQDHLLIYEIKLNISYDAGTQLELSQHIPMVPGRIAYATVPLFLFPCVHTP